jgi:O-antigen/teichoic acid export membrane protein
VLFSPILLVRILDPTSFGQYREFIAYAMIVSGLAAFSITSNILYFIPRHPAHTDRYVGHTRWLTFATSIIACLVLWIFADQIRSNTSFDFLLPLSAYIFLSSNVTYLEPYWIATKQPKFVFYFSTTRTAIRLSSVVVTAYLTRSVESILNALIIVELSRVAIVLLISRRLALTSVKIDRTVISDQLRFIVPLGLATSLHSLHLYLGQIVISMQLGVLALALYSVASYKVPVIRIIRSAVNDAIFPDMVRQASSNQPDKLLLWKRGNIAYSFLIVPIFFVLFWYADVLIPLVFTDDYAAAVPIFRILLLVMPIEAIELNSPLRAINQTRQLLAGNLLLLFANLLCIFVFYQYFREIFILGPALGVVVGYLVQHIYMGWRIIQVYDVSFRKLLKWRGQAAIYASTAAGAMVLYAGEFLPITDYVRLPFFTILYFAAYFAVLHWFRLEEVQTIVTTFRRQLLRRTS